MSDRLRNDEWGSHPEKMFCGLHLSIELIAEIERRRKAWELNSRGEVVEVMLGWMLQELAD